MSKSTPKGQLGPPGSLARAPNPIHSVCTHPRSKLGSPRIAKIPLRLETQPWIRKGCALCRRPRKKINFEFKFTVKLKLGFDFDFDLILISNLNKVGVEVAQISTYHFQI